MSSTSTQRRNYGRARWASRPPLESLGGNFGRKVEMMEEEKKEGRGKRGRKGTERQGKREKGNGKGKEGKIVEENLKLKGERYENEQRTFFFFFWLVTF